MKTSISMKGISFALLCFSSLNLFAEATIDFSYATPDDYMVMGNKKSKETYDIAIKIDDPTLLGSKITGLKVPVVESDNVEDYSMWLTTELVIDKNEDGKKVNIPNICSKSAVRDGDMIQVIFDEPYEITGPVFAGYSFYVATADDVSGCPVVVTEEVNDNAFWFHSTRAVLSWKNQSEATGFSSALTAIIEGDFSPEAVAVANAKNMLVKTGEKVDYSFQVVNHGLDPVSSIGYTYTYGDKSGSDVLTFSTPLAPWYTKIWNVTITLPAMEQDGAADLTVVIDEVNGKKNDDPDNSFTVSLNNLQSVPVHRALLEEFTGLWCGYCVRGYAAIEYMWEHYSDLCVPVVYHNGDPMAIDLPVSVPGFPSGLVDRLKSVDPAYGPGSMGMYEAVAQRSALEAELAIDIKVGNAAEDGMLDFQTELTWVVQPESMDDYSIQWVLMSDNLSDPTWAQSNYYSGSSSVADFPGMQQFIDGGSKVYDLVFNNVAMLSNGAAGEYGLLEGIKVNEPKVLDFTLNYNDAISIYNEECIVQNPEYLKIAVVVFRKDKDGNVEAVNANVCKVDASTGIQGMANVNKEVVSTVYYGMDGRETATPEGLVIRFIRYADGTYKAEKLLIHK